MLTTLEEKDYMLLLDCVEYALVNGDLKNPDYIARARKLKCMLEEQIESCRTSA